MDPHAYWLRRAILRATLRSLTAVALVAGLLTATALALRTSTDPASIVAWSVVAGEAAAVGRFGLAIATNPINTRYLQRYLRAPHAFVRADPPDRDGAEPDQRTRIPPSAGARCVVREVTRETPLHFDIVQSLDRQITMALGRESGSVTLLSCLSDGRLLVTTRELVVPRAELVVRHVPGGDAEDLAVAHRKSIDALAWYGVTPTASGIDIFDRLHYAEHSGYRELGPLLGSLLDLDQATTVLGLAHTPDPDDVFRLGLDASRVAHPESTKVPLTA